MVVVSPYYLIRTQRISILLLVAYFFSGCDLDDFSRVTHHSQLQSEALTDSTGQFQMTLTFSNTDASEKQLTFNSDLDQSLDLHVRWYCGDSRFDADAGKSQKVAPQNSEYYEVLLAEEEEHQVQLKGHWKTTSDSFAIIFKGYDKEYVLPRTPCDGKVGAKIHAIASGQARHCVRARGLYNISIANYH